MRNKAGKIPDTTPIRMAPKKISNKMDGFSIYPIERALFNIEVKKGFSNSIINKAIKVASIADS